MNLAIYWAVGAIDKCYCGESSYRMLDGLHHTKIVSVSNPGISEKSISKGASRHAQPSLHLRVSKHTFTLLSLHC